MFDFLRSMLEDLIQPNRPLLGLAPMAGVTDAAFRTLCGNHGADFTMSEFASADGIYYEDLKIKRKQKQSTISNQQSSNRTIEPLNHPNKRLNFQDITELFNGKRSTHRLLSYRHDEKPLMIQIFGKNPDTFAEAARAITEMHHADPKSPIIGININFGCPAKKVTHSGCGVELMANPKLARKLVEETINHTDLPVSIKTRAGIRDTDVFKFLDNLLDLNIEMVAVHCRTYEGKFNAPINFPLLKKVRDVVPKHMVVLGNGGLNTPEDIKYMVEETGADGILVARGVYGNPWIFSETKKMHEGKPFVQHPDELDRSERFDTALAHARILFEEKGDLGMLEIRKHLGWYVKGLPNAKELRSKLVQVKSVEEIENIFHKM
jgi:tRNA-dihydrouridine synthase B